MSESVSEPTPGRVANGAPGAPASALRGAGGRQTDRFLLTLRALPSHLAIDTRLKAALKRLLRDYKLRCESCRPISGTELAVQVLKPRKSPANPNESR